MADADEAPADSGSARSHVPGELAIGSPEAGGAAASAGGVGSGPWQMTRRQWLVGTAIALAGVLAGTAGWAQFFKPSPAPQPIPAPQVTVQVPAQLAGPNDPRPIAQNPEPQPGESGCRDDPGDSSGLGGWGPARNLLPTEKVSVFPSFNIDDASPYGNEMWFFTVRDMSLPKGSPWLDEVKAEPGKTYVFRAFVHNSAGSPVEDIARDTRISVNLPTCTGRRIATTMSISSSNAEPQRIWDSIHLFSDEPFGLAYAPGTAVLCNNFYLCKTLEEGGNDGAEISNDFLTDTGALIGFNALDGRMPGGYEHSAYFYFQARVQGS